MNKNKKILNTENIICFVVLICLLILTIGFSLMHNHYEKEIVEILKTKEESHCEISEENIPQIKSCEHISKVTFKEDNQINVEFTNEVEETNVIEEKEKEFDSLNLTEKDKFLLAKIAMAEAEASKPEMKAYVILTILNRVKSDKFPDTVEEVIFQEYNGIYQFTPVVNGRWDKVNPNEDCFNVLEDVLNDNYDNSEKALFFESCENPNNWHSRNLNFIIQCESMRFYN